MPDARACLMASAFSADTCGRPSFLPCALARARPANNLPRFGVAFYFRTPLCFVC